MLYSFVYFLNKYMKESDKNEQINDLINFSVFAEIIFNVWRKNKKNYIVIRVNKLIICTHERYDTHECIENKLS